MDDPSCPCKPAIPREEWAPETKPDEQEEASFKHVVGNLTFEPTVVGATAKQTFVFQNESKETQSYTTKRDPNINPIYHAFDFKLAKTKVASGDYLECTVTYAPQVAHQKSMDYLQILDNNLKLYQVCLQGQCSGPSVHTSVKTLYFFNTKSNKGLMNTFEIKNMSDVPTAFQFDINEDDADQEAFKLDRIRGTLGPFQHTYVIVRFATNNNGVYCKNLFCMIMNQEPVMMELIGIQMPDLDFNLHETALRRYQQTKEETHGYSGYMRDSVKTATRKPPFSLSVNYLDFTRVEFQKNANNSRTLVTSLTNHLKEEIEIVWINGFNKKDVFSVSPEEVIVPPEESILYEFHFRPDIADQLYAKLLTANVYWTDFRRTLKETTSIEAIDVPLNLSLKVLGHSFPENKVWLPLVEIKPNVVILPPCTPMVPSYTTLMLKSSGHLPTSFKFIPPKKTNFLLKPMEGILYNFQIAVAQLQPDSHNKKAYVERWGVELNGRTEDCLPFYLKGYSEYASILVGVDNVVAFKTVHPGCQDILNVMVKNTSIHFIKYNFLADENNHFSINHPKGELASNETIFLEWYFTGNLKAPEVSLIDCEIRTVQNCKLITGPPLHASVKVYAKCAYSELCATPNSFDFGITKWGTKHSTVFHLFNFGESEIHFELMPKNPVEAHEELTILPTKGTVCPKQNVKIIVQIKATKMEQQEIKLTYRVRLNKVSNIIIDDGREYDIFDMQYDCMYPTLQITDICSNNFGFLFTKMTLWDMFNIDEINQALKTIRHDETKTVDMFVPEYEMGEADFFAKLLIRNETQFRTEMRLKREKICDCKLISKPKGLSFRQTAYDCIHRDMLTLALSDECVEPNMTQKLRMDVKYLEHGLTRMMYILTLSDNRTINIFININVLPQEITVASKYAHGYELKLSSVYIGEKHPPVQAFYLYNNSEAVIDYSIDIIPLQCLNFDYDFEIFSCLNPTGSLSPFSSYEIIFSFTPIEARRYNVTVPLKMGEQEFSLQISGDGVLFFDRHMCDGAHPLPCTSQTHYMENPIELSVDYLDVEPFLVWSTVDKMVFISNHTSDSIIGYAWEGYTVAGIVHAEMVNKKGVLKPKETHANVIRINSFDQPCRLRLRMVCKLLDHSQHIRHKESVAAYNRKQEELAGQFTITEDGIFYPENDVVILPKAEQFFTTLTINICVVSVADRDLWLNREEQLEQSSQYNLRIDTNDIFSEYFQPLIPQGSQLCLPISSEEDETGDHGHPKAQQHCCRIDMSKEDLKLYNTVLECLIADAVLSELFCKIVTVTNNSPQPYYLQFKMVDDPIVPSITKKDLQEKEQEGLERRMGLVKNFLNRPQAPYLTDIFKELVTDSIHQIFKLGPQIKKQPHKHIYHSEKSKFACETCKCDQ